MRRYFITLKSRMRENDNVEFELEIDSNNEIQINPISGFAKAEISLVSEE